MRIETWILKEGDKIIVTFKSKTFVKNKSHMVEVISEPYVSRYGSLCIKFQLPDSRDKIATAVFNDEHSNWFCHKDFDLDFLEVRNP